MTRNGKDIEKEYCDTSYFVAWNNLHDSMRSSEKILEIKYENDIPYDGWNVYAAQMIQASITYLHKHGWSFDEIKVRTEEANELSWKYHHQPFTDKYLEYRKTWSDDLVRMLNDPDFRTMVEERTGR
jgi:hypothetical protein